MSLCFVNLKSRDVVCIISIRTSFSEVFSLLVFIDYLFYARLYNFKSQCDGMAPCSLHDRSEL